ncbi:antitoxin component of RelBE/YafQ-DinJ toxin-antitoxin module [Paraburkholderia bannensis]|uniref:Antitoxin component of RelBE/YafQ-DinJ toxin-antitoxin module n=1 Tax=Paraburkholderia bannensis TaxID=765414 RepID=A0A7W9WVJ7_9BURK|nr:MULTISPECIES: plasmid mobilization relaxosome protein MobC [Paraburkholderia]MBB3260381.1 antitoxin component of RelBE/YafQ-DinJ toxin-antitoxin module [Paraburkholderia sp. WP4_3_2]MBB6105417.1 antitoxin component of RelBE/YafQ-DinJ toxin-antitoxin module [Paraburkholderia bannensis]
MNEYETIRARVSRETKLKFAAAAQRHGCRSEAQLLRLMLDKVLQTEEMKSALPPTRKSRNAGTQVNVLLTFEEHQLLTAAATGEGLRRTEWIVKLIRATLLRQPQFNRTEVDALAESSRQLAAIGRNLNQIARTLNMDPNASRSVTVERVETLSAEIKRHCALVAELTDASISRRSAKP